MASIPNRRLPRLAMFHRNGKFALNFRNPFSRRTKRGDSKFRHEYFHVKCGDAEFIKLYCSDVAGAGRAVEDLDCFGWLYQNRFIMDILRVLTNLYEKNPEENILEVYNVYLNR